MVDHAAIEVEALSKTYRDGLFRRRAFTALRGVTFQVQRGEIFGLLGPNGAGKTTLVKLLLGVVRTAQGSARVLGRPVGDRAVRQRIGYLPENLRLPRHHTALTALRLFGQMNGLTRREVQLRSGPLLARVGLADRAHDAVRKYSKGMLQRLGLAIALLDRPELVFLDEPTDGLDPPARAQVRQLLLQLKQEGTTIFLNSHLLQEVELVCDRVAILDRGVLKGLGSVEQLVPSHGEGFELEVQIAAPAAAVQRALADRQPGPRIEPLSPEQSVVHLPVRHQTDVDGYIDLLRQQHLSIVALGRRRIGLEEAFLHVLGLPAAEADAT